MPSDAFFSNLMETIALRFHQFGDPAQVLRPEPIPAGKPGPGQVLLRLLAAPINPSDLGSIAGTYGELPTLPAVAGREGAGEVLETGTGVNDLVAGDRVLLPEGLGSWRETMLADAASLTRVPADVAVEQAAMATINPPTAWLLLESFGRLREGDWIIQNAANSAVGHYVIQLCRQRGVRTINIVRRPEWIERLKEAGADAVLLDGPDLPSEAREIAGKELPLLGLNSVGGTSASGLIKCLGDGGTLVTFGGMTGEPVRFPTRYLIFNDIRLVGFWLHRWKKEHPASEKRELMEKIFGKMEQGVLQAPVEATYRLQDFAEALKHTSSPGRKGKVLFVGAP